MDITSDFAILDVKEGREKLFEHFGSNHEFDATKKIPVTIHGFITNAWGDDDTVSREFAVEVVEVDLA